MTHPTHIVAVMGIVRNASGQILLIQSPQRGWEPPGGQVENGEDMLSALKREVMEESGIVIETGKLVAIYSNVVEPTKVLFTFEAKAVGGKLTRSSESLDVGWFVEADAIERVTHPSQRQKLQDGISSEELIYRVYRTNPYELFESKSI